MTSLSREELEVVRQEPFYKNDVHYETLDGATKSEYFYYSDDDLPYKPLSTYRTVYVAHQFVFLHHINGICPIATA